MLSLSGVDASEEKARERADARGSDTAVTFELPSGETACKAFGQGQEVGALKLWLVEEFCFEPSSLALTFDGKPLIDMFSLADVPGIAGAAEATISVAGTVDRARVAATSEAKAADAAASADMDEAAADGGDDEDDGFAEA